MNKIVFSKFTVINFMNEKNMHYNYYLKLPSDI